MSSCGNYNFFNLIFTKYSSNSILLGNNYLLWHSFSSEFLRFKRASLKNQPKAYLKEASKQNRPITEVRKKFRSQMLFIVNQPQSYVPKLVTDCCACSGITITRHTAQTYCFTRNGLDTQNYVALLKEEYSLRCSMTIVDGELVGVR